MPNNYDTNPLNNPLEDARSPSGQRSTEPTPETRTQYIYNESQTRRFDEHPPSDNPYVPKSPQNQPYPNQQPYSNQPLYQNQPPYQQNQPPYQNPQQNYQDSQQQYPNQPNYQNPYPNAVNNQNYQNPYPNNPNNQNPYPNYPNQQQFGQNYQVPPQTPPNFNNFNQQQFNNQQFNPKDGVSARTAQIQIPPTTRAVAGIGLPENIMAIVPYLPFGFGIFASLGVLLLTDRTEARVRFHAAQALCLHLLWVIVITTLGLLNNFNSFANLINNLFQYGFIILMIFVCIRVWQGKPFRIEQLYDLTDWVESKIYINRKPS